MGNVLFTSAILAGIGSASNNCRINTSLILNLKPGKVQGILNGEYNCKQKKWLSNTPQLPQQSNQQGTLTLFKWYPDDEIIFTWKKGFPIVEPSQLACLNPEFYFLYKKFKRHYKQYRLLRNFPWFLTSYFSIPFYILTNNNRYNHKVYKKLHSTFNSKINEN